MRFGVIALILLSLQEFHCIAKDSDRNYDVSKIDPALLLNADVVIRKNNTFVNIKNKTSINIEVIKAVTILNINGMHEATLSIPYGSFSEVTQVEGKLYNSGGGLIREIKKEEIKDYANGGNYLLFDDSRIKTVEIYSNKFPFTFEYRYIIKINGYISPETWFATESSKISIENCSLKIDVDNSCKLIWREFNLTPCNIVSDKNINSYSWKVSNFAALPKEEKIPHSVIIYPSVIYFTEKFQIEKITGEFSTWNDFGKFFYTLNEGLDILNDDAKKEIQEKVRGQTDKREKIKTLYNWMQSQTRYVGVEKGIGGWKTFDANYVYKNKYGDCKALVNYMKTILLETGIKSYPSLIYGGDEKNYFDPELPYNYFNHVILCIPLETDTVWLECTSQEEPFNYLGTFTSDRYCLVIGRDISRLVHTPTYNSDLNRSELSSDIKIFENGTSNCFIRLIQSGELHDDTRSVQYSASEKDQKEWIHNQILIADYTFKSFHFVETGKDTPLSKLELEIESSSLCTASGTRIFIHPKLCKGLIDLFPSETTRRFPMELGPEAHESNLITIKLPSNYLPESVDKNEKITSDFAEYEYGLKYDKNVNSLIVNEIFILKKINITPEKYPEWLDFRNKVMNFKNQTLVCKHY